MSPTCWSAARPAGPCWTRPAAPASTSPWSPTAAGDTYHFYPSRTQVDGWLEQAGLVVVSADHSTGDGYGYLHLLLTGAGQGSV
jgi:hypothetical protein